MQSDIIKAVKESGLSVRDIQNRIFQKNGLYVGISSIQRAINGMSQGVFEELRKDILEIIEEAKGENNEPTKK